MRPEVTGYEVRSDTSIVVEYDLHRPDGVAVVCRISALDGGRNRVGTVEDAVPAEGATSVHRVVSLRTSVRAVTGVVDSCTRVLRTPLNRRRTRPGRPPWPTPVSSTWWRSGPGLVD